MGLTSLAHQAKLVSQAESKGDRDMIAKNLTNGTAIRSWRIVDNENVGYVDQVERIRSRPGKVRVWLQSGQPLNMDEFEIVDVVDA